MSTEPTGDDTAAAQGGAELVLHIGSPKTGTTAIQKLLTNRAPRLAEHGIFVPTGSDWGSNHVRLAFFAAQEGRRADLCRRLGIGPEVEAAVEARIQREVQEFAARAPRVVMTSEFLYELATEAELARLARLLAPFRQLRIAFYIRPQDQMFQSEVSQRIKSGQYRAATYLNYSPARFDYLARAELWAATFGAESLHVIDYTRATEGNVSVAADFFRRYRLPLDPAAPPSRQNPSLDVAKLALLCRFNRLAAAAGISRETAPLRSRLIAQLEQMPAWGPRFRLSAEICAEIAATANPRNADLSQRFLSGESFQVSVPESQESTTIEPDRADGIDLAAAVRLVCMMKDAGLPDPMIAEIITAVPPSPAPAARAGRPR